MALGIYFWATAPCGGVWILKMQSIWPKGNCFFSCLWPCLPLSHLACLLCCWVSRVGWEAYEFAGGLGSGGGWAQEVLGLGCEGCWLLAANSASKTQSNLFSSVLEWVTSWNTCWAECDAPFSFPMLLAPSVCNYLPTLQYSFFKCSFCYYL